MPKKPLRDNRGVAELRTVHTAAAGAARVLQRISRRARVVLPPAEDGPARDISWVSRLRAALPDELRMHLLQVLEKERELVLFADSAVWAGRLRLALPDLEPLAGDRRLTVRLQPGGNRSQ